MALRRIAAYLLDGFLIVVWGGLLFGAVVLAVGRVPRDPADPWTGQLIGLLTMTLPVVLAFTWCDVRFGGTPGKRLLGLYVRARFGGRLGPGRALVRNLIKFTPWELGHLVAWQARLAEATLPPPWVWAVSILSLTLPLWWLAVLRFEAETPYDRWTSTVVRRS